MAIELIDTVRPKNNQPFPIVLSEDIKGGLQYADSYDVMLSIAQGRRSAGMMCYVRNDQFYSLDEDLTTWLPMGKMRTVEVESLDEVDRPQDGQIVFISNDTEQQYLYFWNGSEWCNFNVIKETYNYTVATEQERDRLGDEENLPLGAFCFVEKTGYMYFYTETGWRKLNISVDMDMSMYAKLTDLETKSDVGHIHDYSELTNPPVIPTLDGYATEEFVKNAIAQAQLEEEEIDLSGYTTQTQLQEGLSTKADEEHVHSYEELIDVPIIPSLDGYATEEYVDNEMIFDYDMNTVNSLGGIKAGENLNGLTVKEVLNKLLFPYVQPGISGSLIYSPSGSVFEKGQTVTITGIRCSVTTKSEPIDRVQFYDGNTLLKTTPTTTSGTYEHSFVEPVLITSNLSNSRFRVAVRDTRNTYYANTNSLSFYYPYYIGTILENEVLTNDVIINLPKKVQSKATITNNFSTNNECMLIAYPKSYGALRQIVDANGFDVTNTFTQNEMIVTGLDGTNQTYYVYINKASTVSNFKMTFYY